MICFRQRFTGYNSPQVCQRTLLRPSIRQVSSRIIPSSSSIWPEKEVQLFLQVRYNIRNLRQEDLPPYRKLYLSISHTVCHSYFSGYLVKTHILRMHPTDKFIKKDWLLHSIPFGVASLLCSDSSAFFKG